MKKLFIAILILSQWALGDEDCLRLHRKLSHAFFTQTSAASTDKQFPSFLIPAEKLNGPSGTEIVELLNRGQKGTLTGTKGVTLHYSYWEVPNERAAIVFAPGMKESYLFHPELIHDLVTDGYSVYAMDPRGQGLSGRLGKKSQIVHVDDFKDYVEDQSLFINTVVQAKPHTKVYGLGYSMGGLITTLAALENPEQFQATAAIAPPYGVNTFPIPGTIAKGILNTQIYMGNERKYTLFQKDVDPENPLAHIKNPSARMRFNEVQLLKNKQLVMGGPSNGWVKATIEAGEFALSKATEYPLSHFLVKMNQDKVVVPQKIENFAANSKMSSLTSLENAGHSIFQSRDENRHTTVTQVLRFFIHPESLHREISQKDLDQLIQTAENYSTRNETALARYTLDEAALLLKELEKSNQRNKIDSVRFKELNSRLWHRIKTAPLAEQGLYLYLSESRKTELQKLYPN